MKILKYKYSDGPGGGWDYSWIQFRKANLLVGESGSGKTKLLNTIFNIGGLVAKSTASRGSWEIEVEISKVRYIWKYLNISGNVINQESLVSISNEKEDQIVVRTAEEFIFNGNKLPKLSGQISALSLLKEEDSIKPLYEGFTKIARRNFFSDELERACALSNIPGEVHRKLTEKKDISFITLEIPLSARLQLLKEFFKDDYDQLCQYYKSIFRNIESFDFANLETVHPEVHIENSAKIRVFSIKEKAVNKLVGIHDLSSGMQKVLLLLTDIITLPGDWIYLVDEYENSLGINAINFLPDFLVQYGKDNQFIITTHHPYLINNMPIKDWLVFNRTGSNVNVIYGNQLEERLGKSSQQAFLKLINDPIYTGG